MYIEVTIEKATHLPVISSFSSSVRAYVIVRWGKSSGKTSIANSSNDPEFNETLVLEAGNSTYLMGCPLIIEVWDHNSFIRDVIIGSTNINLFTLKNSLNDGKIKQHLSIHNANLGITGCVFFALNFPAGIFDFPFTVIKHCKSEIENENFIWGLVEETSFCILKDQERSLSESLNKVYCKNMEKINMKTCAIDGNCIAGLATYPILLNEPNECLLMRHIGTILSHDFIDRINPITIITCDEMKQPFTIICPIFATRVFDISGMATSDIKNSFVSGYAQLRQDLREQAEAYSSNFILGYREIHYIDKTVVSISAYGTACITNEECISNSSPNLLQSSLKPSLNGYSRKNKISATIRRPQSLEITKPSRLFTYATTAPFDIGPQTERYQTISNIISELYEESTQKIVEFLATKSFNAIFSIELGIAFSNSSVFFYLNGIASNIESYSETQEIYKKGGPHNLPIIPTSFSTELKDKMENIYETHIIEKEFPNYSCKTGSVSVSESSMTPSDFLTSQVSDIFDNFPCESYISNVSYKIFFLDPNHLVSVTKYSYSTPNIPQFIVTPSEKVEKLFIENRFFPIYIVISRTVPFGHSFGDSIKQIMSEGFALLNEKTQAVGSNAVICTHFEFCNYLPATDESFGNISLIISGDVVFLR